MSMVGTRVFAPSCRRLFCFLSLHLSRWSAAAEEQGLPAAAAVHGIRHRHIHLRLHTAGADPVRAGIR